MSASQPQLRRDSLRVHGQAASTLGRPLGLHPDCASVLCSRLGGSGLRWRCEPRLHGPTSIEWQSRTRAGQCAILEPGACLVTRSTGRTGKLARLPATPSSAGKCQRASQHYRGPSGWPCLAGRCQRRSPTSPRSVSGAPGTFHRAAVTGRAGGPGRAQAGVRPLSAAALATKPAPGLPVECRCRVRSESAGPGHALATRKQSAQQHAPHGGGPAR